MTAVFHALNIGTLACWLSVAVFGSVALVVPDLRVAPIVVKTEREIQSLTEDFTLGEAEPAEEIATATPVEATEVPAEILSAPPEVPQIDEFAPLPEIPEIPRPATEPSSYPAPVQAQTRPRPSQPGKSTSTGNPGASESSRLAQGRMPKPTYPVQAKRGGQSGTVVIEFSVNTSGGVISAYAKSSSGWPLLDAEAVRTVLGWSFPAGGVMTLERRIIFQLN
jgi:protein TonB